jgi:Periplasmic component of the Tol biopolymer transport system
MDQDGENNRYLTDGSNLVLTPRFSPSSQDITYLSYRNNRPRVYLLNIETDSRRCWAISPA